MWRGGRWAHNGALQRCPGPHNDLVPRRGWKRFACSQGSGSLLRPCMFSQQITSAWRNLFVQRSKIYRWSIHDTISSSHPAGNAWHHWLQAWLGVVVKELLYPFAQQQDGDARLSKQKFSSSSDGNLWQITDFQYGNVNDWYKRKLNPKNQPECSKLQIRYNFFCSFCHFLVVEFWSWRYPSTDFFKNPVNWNLLNMKIQREFSILLISYDFS